MTTAVNAMEATPDLFLGNLVEASMKDDRELMSNPYFALKKQRQANIVYSSPHVTIEITSGTDKEGDIIGIATIWDKDILLYITTLINAAIDSGRPISREVMFCPYDFLKATGRSTGKRGYTLFYEALRRLHKTNILTTVEADGQVHESGFHWIENYKFVKRTLPNGKEIHSGVIIKLNKWSFDAITKDRRVLTINTDYFDLTKGMERRLYEIARKHVGRQSKWSISLEKLAEKCGTSQKLRQFKADLNKIIDDDNIPDYRLTIIFENGTWTEQSYPRSGPRKNGKDSRAMVIFTPKTSIRTNNPNLMIPAE